MKKIILPFIIFFCTHALAQNIGINTDGSVSETGVMLDIKEPTAKATTAAVQTFFQIKSFDANTDALKLRLGFKTDATQANRYGFIDFPDFTASVPTYLPLCLQPSGGNVGIGTTAPATKLHVLGDAMIGTGSNTYPTTPAGSTALTLNSTSLARLVMNDGTGQFQQYLNAYYETAAAAHKYVISAAANRFTATAGTFGFYVAPSGTAGNAITWTNGLYINNSGNVGINQTTPTAKLEVNGTSGSTIKIVDGNQAANKVLASDATGQGSWQSLSSIGGGGCFNNWQLFIASGTFTVPAGVTSIKIAVWGGGSGGGNDGGFGGGGGGYAEGIYTVVPATVYQVLVGAGGAGGGTIGGQSCFSTGAACTGTILISTTASATYWDGGMGSGGYLNTTLGAGGAPGEVGISSGLNGEGGGGSGGPSTATYAGGGGGGGVGGGRGGTGGSGTGSYTAALANTGAGGGGACAAGTARTGKAGAAGKVIVFW